MKRLATLLVAFAMVFGTISKASAVDFNASGVFQFAGQYVDNADLRDKGSDGFDAIQRFRTQIDIVANENLSGTVFFEVGTITWGNEATGGDLGTDGINVETRRAYIDFLVPNTALNFRLGLQGVALPSATFGNQALDDDMAAVVASYDLGELGGVSAFWGRLQDDPALDNLGNKLGDQKTDIFGIAAEINVGPVKVSPYALYGYVNDVYDVQDTFIRQGSGKAYWVGTALEANLGNLFLGADFFYGNADAGSFDTDRAHGFFASAKVAYATEWVTPTLGGWYSSGEKENRAMTPVISSCGLDATIFGTDGGFYDTAATIITANGVGTTGVVFGFENFSFLEDLTHGIRVAYIVGTSDKGHGLAIGGESFDEDAYAFEVNFDTNYQVYENLTAILELAWVRAHFDKVTPGTSKNRDAYKAAIGFAYAF